MATLSFQADIKAFSEKTKIKATTVVRKVVFDIDSGIVQMMPVDTGHARTNWQVAIGAMNDNQLYGTQSAEDTLQEAQSTINAIQGGDVVYIFNNLPYIEVLEYGKYPDPPEKGTYLREGQVKGEYVGKGYFFFSEGGYSKQAPGGFARITLERVKDGFDAIVNGVAQGDIGPDELGAS